LVNEANGQASPAPVDLTVTFWEFWKDFRGKLEMLATQAFLTAA
jgi:hypothetical protein